MDFSLSKICFSEVDQRVQDTHLTSSTNLSHVSFLRYISGCDSRLPILLSIRRLTPPMRDSFVM
jgi:hypothetical protein